LANQDTSRFDVPTPHDQYQAFISERWRIDFSGESACCVGHSHVDEDRDAPAGGAASRLCPVAEQCRTLCGRRRQPCRNAEQATPCRHTPPLRTVKVPRTADREIADDPFFNG